MALYHGDNNCFPLTAAWDGRRTPPYLNFFSIHGRLLPYLDQNALFHGIHFEVGTIPPEDLESMENGGSQIAHFGTVANVVNATASRNLIAVFLCPSDRASLATAGNNYRANIGVGPSPITTAEHPDSGNGLFNGLGLTKGRLHRRRIEPYGGVQRAPARFRATRDEIARTRL